MNKDKNVGAEHRNQRQNNQSTVQMSWKIRELDAKYILQISSR